MTEALLSLDEKCRLRVSSLLELPAVGVEEAWPDPW